MRVLVAATILSYPILPGFDRLSLRFRITTKWCKTIVLKSEPIAIPSPPIVLASVVLGYESSGARRIPAVTTTEPIVSTVQWGCVLVRARLFLLRDSRGNF
ncbi:hypothetical protein B0H12DRAFT_1108694 [Mycena haematopus]|nr:hypothetical protein B0H12DRAFT_1108694 [Mycena haematopus]